MPILARVRDFLKFFLVAGQGGLRLTFTLMGAPPQPKKGFVPMADRRYLGASVQSGHRELYVSNPSGSLRPRLYPASITPMRLANSGEI